MFAKTFAAVELAYVSNLNSEPSENLIPNISFQIYCSPFLLTQNANEYSFFPAKEGTFKLFRKTMARKDEEIED